MNGAWTVADIISRTGDPSPVVVPAKPQWALGNLCRAGSPDHYMCTRRQGHAGRHAAVLSDGQVYAVWPEPEATA